MLRSMTVLLPTVFLSALALRMTELGAMPWYLSRAAGLTSFAALSASVILGLLLSNRNNPRWLKKPLVFEMHQFLSVLAVVFVAVHVASLMFDRQVAFTPVQLLVPFAAPYQRVWVGVGVLAAWLVTAITASFWMKKRIGHRAWRMLHMGSFAGYLMAFGHGIAAGTDTGLVPVYWMYALSAASVAALTVLRVGQRHATARRPVTARARAAHQAATASSTR